MGTLTKWAPLLHDTQARRAWTAIEEIRERLARSAADHEAFDVAYGAAGIAAFFAQYARVRADAGGRESDLAMESLERAFHGVATQNTGWTLFTGFTGVVWVGEMLTGDAQNALDDALLALASRPEWRGQYDLISGLTGLGIWALDAAPRPATDLLLARITQHLCDRSEPTAQGRRLWTQAHLLVADQRAHYPAGYENCGTAHGQPAAVAFLAEALASGRLPAALHAIAKATTGELLTHMLAHAHAGDPRGLRWPSLVGETGKRDGGRQAWCYGDLGVAASLAVAGGAAQRSGLAEATACITEAHTTALRAADWAVDAAGLTESGLCHGTSGNALLFARLHQRFGGHALADAARRWYAATLDAHRPGELGAGFVVRLPGEPASEQLGFLQGLAGVGLSLLAAVSDVEPTWDRMLYASSSPRVP